MKFKYQLSHYFLAVLDLVKVTRLLSASLLHLLGMGSDIVPTDRPSGNDISHTLLALCLGDTGH